MAAAIPSLVAAPPGLTASAVGGAFLGKALGKKKDTTPAPSQLKAPDVPTTEERALAITDAARREELLKKTRKGFASSILTSPLGISKEARTSQKTLLGE